MYDENSNAGVVLGSTASSTTSSSSAVASTGLMSQLLNVKDSRWLQLEVCREFQRGQCSRSDLECKFAHPPPHVDVQNGRVTACYDSIKGRCTRENPKCKYLHPPQHLKDQLLINGRNNLALKNLICTQLNQNAAAVAAPTASLTMNPLGQLMVSGQASPATLNDSLIIVQQQQQQQQHQQQQQQQQQVAAAAAAAQAATLVPTNALPYQYYQGIATMYPTIVPVATSDAYQAQVQAQLAALQSFAAMSQATVAGTIPMSALAAPVTAVPATATLHSTRKRTLQEVSPSPSSVITSQQLLQHHHQQQQQQQYHQQQLEHNSLLLAAAAAAAAAGATVPCKRPAADKSGLPVYANGVGAQLTAAHIPQATATFNPYLIPGISYMPTVSFSGQIPPRF